MASNSLKRVFELQETPDGFIVDLNGRKYLRNRKTGELRRVSLRKSEARKRKKQLRGDTKKKNA